MQTSGCSRSGGILFFLGGKGEGWGLELRERAWYVLTALAHAHSIKRSAMGGVA